MNPAFLLGIAFNIAYWYRKYHSGIICKGVNNILNSIELSECENINILKLFWYNILIK
jgi:hypothetical protein